MKNIAVLLFVFIAATAGAQQEKPIITVLDFQTNNISESDMKSIVTFLSAELFETGVYKVIDSNQRDALLKELEFSMSGCTDESCQLEVGKMLAAEFIVVGDLGKVGDRIIITIKVLNTETSETLNTARSVYMSMNELVDDLRNIALRIAKKDVPAKPEDLVKKDVPAKTDDIGLDKITEKENSRRKTSGRKTFGAVMMVGGGAMLAAGGVFIVGAISQYDRVQDRYDEYYNAPDMYDGNDDGDESAFVALSDSERSNYLDPYWDNYTRALEDQKTAGLIGVIGLGAGLLTTTVGIIIHAKAKAAEKVQEKPVSEMSAVVSPFGARFKISF